MEPKLPTPICFHLAHDARDYIFRRDPHQDMNAIDLHFQLLSFYIGVIVLDLTNLWGRCAKLDQSTGGIYTRRIRPNAPARS